MMPFEWQEGRQPRRLLCFSAAFFIEALVFSLSVCCKADLLSSVLYTVFFGALIGVIIVCWLKDSFYLFLPLLLGLLTGVLWCGGYGLLRWLPTQAYDGTVGEVRLELTEYAQGKESYGIVQGIITQLDGEACRLKVQAYLQDGSPDYAPGDVLLFSGKLQAARRDVGANLLQEGVFLTLSQEGDCVCQPGAAMTLLRRARILSRSITETAMALIPGDEGALLASLLSGERDNFSPGFDRALITSGTRHIISVSGLHLAILAGILINLLGKKAGLLAAVPAAVIYSAIVGFSPSVVRSTVLLIFWAAAFWLKQEKDSLTSFAAGLLLLVLWNPFCCLSIGLLLSFGATLGLILLSAPLNEPLIRRIKTIQNQALKQILWYVSGTVTATLSATLFTTPLTVLFFDTVPLLSILSNVLILWVMSFIMLSGILTLFIHLFAPWTAMFLADNILIWPLRWCVLVIRTIGQSRFAATDSANLLILLCCFGILAALFFWKNKRLPGKALIALSLALICITGIFTTGERLLFGRVEIQNAGGQPVVLLRGDSLSLINTGIRSQTTVDSVQTALSRWNESTLDTVLCTTETYKTQNGLLSLLSEVESEKLLLPGTSGELSDQLAQAPIDTYSASGAVSISGCRVELMAADGGGFAWRLLCGELSLFSLNAIRPKDVPDILSAYNCSADLLLVDDTIANDWALLYDICKTVQPREIILTTNGYSEHNTTFTGIPLTMLQWDSRAFSFRR